MFVRQLVYLVALAREQHFARAAEACHVSQPALSSAIRKLEDELGVAIVRRGQRFNGLTPEGERLLVWARRVLENWEGLQQEAALAKRRLSGVLRLGVIPTALPVIPLLTGPCREVHPELGHEVLSLASEDILHRLDDFRLDFGLTYLEDQRLRGFTVLPLYRESYVLLTRDTDRVGGSARSLSWSEVADLPLCLLTANMQYRRIVDGAFREAGVTPRLSVETDSIFALYAHVRYGGLYSVVPHSMLFLFEMRQEVSAIPLTPPLSRSIGLIALEREPLPPLQAAAWSVFRDLELQARFDALISGMH